MQFHTQLILNHNPEENIFGDCQRTCIACMLDKHPLEVPNFADNETWRDGSKFDQVINEYLHTQGLSLVSIAFENQDMSGLLTAIGGLNTEFIYMLCGRSERNINHVVVCQGKEIIHDPHPSNAKITLPCDDGYYWIYFLVPKKFNVKE